MSSTHRGADTHRAVTERARARPDRAAALLSVRLLRRGVAIMAGALAAYSVLEVEVFERTYPDQQSRELLVRLGQDPALQFFSGSPYGTSVGALALWDAGWLFLLIVGVWAVVTTARLLRADEDAGRTDLLLTGPVRAARLLVGQLAVLLGACVAVGVVHGCALALAGAQWGGSLLYGALVVGVGATFVAVTATACQLLAPRGRALGLGALLLGASFLLRMVANSADERAWLRWVTPLGWIDQVRPFGDDRVVVLLLPLAVTATFATAAVLLRRGRDTGAALLRERGSHRSHRLGLGGPTAFAARSAAPVVLAWVVGLAAWGALAGSLLPIMARFVEQDASYRAILEAFGMDADAVVGEFLAMTAAVTGVALGLFVAWRLGAARADEASGRLDLLLCRPLRRRHWLAGHAGVTAGAVVLLAAVEVVALLVGSGVSGGQAEPLDVVRAMANVLPAVAVFEGVTLLTVGLAPRLTIAVGAAVPILTYVVQLLGPALDWPQAVVGLSPFEHLAAVPVEPVALAPVLVLSAIAVALGATGVLAFERRDLTSA
ncbi:hypothetical protein ACTHAM_001889 [Cellulomonas soli]|uniref:hypothetical protein n=1 Tax=Cellulomonas soli TaxID=931535 RepID=UPI003F86889C